ncbi:MAG: insulinase family protein, partial [Firmicutes bacterium]|nr:insulinase family protein [Bacillota bacterium]
MEKVRGYRVVQSSQLKELGAWGTELVHEKSGARICCIENPQDSNKVFSISFCTPPQDDSGTPHILEHSVLCGSDKFPLKDPFMELAKGSVNTFLNAMTFGDKTM